MSNRKAELTWENVIYIILGLIILAVLGMMIYRSTNQYTSSFDPIKAKIIASECKMKGKQLFSGGKELDDCDLDGYPDSCDLCINADESKDGDGDGVSDDCEYTISTGSDKAISCRYKTENGKTCAVKPTRITEGTGFTLTKTDCKSGKLSKDIKFIYQKEMTQEEFKKLTK